MTINKHLYSHFMAIFLKVWSTIVREGNGNEIMFDNKTGQQSSNTHLPKWRLLRISMLLA